MHTGIVYAHRHVEGLGVGYAVPYGWYRHQRWIAYDVADGRVSLARWRMVADLAGDARNDIACVVWVYPASWERWDISIWPEALTIVPGLYAWGLPDRMPVDADPVRHSHPSLPTDLYYLPGASWWDAWDMAVGGVFGLAWWPRGA